jgi:hypothetical protein
MKSLAALLFFATPVLLLAESLENLWKSDSPDGSYLAATRRIPDKKYVWRDDLDGFRLVVFPLKPGPEHNTGNLYFSQDFPGRIPVQVQWSPDSHFIVLTTTSSGGHSPWHYTSYVFSVADRRVVSPDETIGPVVSPEFTFKPPHTVVLGVGKSGAEGIDFERPTKTDVDASRLFSGKK